jgi:hypothetical protein
MPPPANTLRRLCLTCHGQGQNKQIFEKGAVEGLSHRLFLALHAKFHFGRGAIFCFAERNKKWRLAQKYFIPPKAAHDNATTSKVLLA